MKRERQANFSADEVDVLLKTISNFKNIIENKKTDAITWQQKDNAWDKITTQFNSSSGKCLRNKKSLRAKYEDLKKAVKKKLANNRMELFKTGGGQAQTKNLTNVEEQMLSMLPSMIHGLSSPWDCDREAGLC